jgi:hypothetical protein
MVGLVSIFRFFFGRGVGKSSLRFFSCTKISAYDFCFVFAGPSSRVRVLMSFYF